MFIISPVSAASPASVTGQNYGCSNLGIPGVIKLCIELENLHIH